MARYIDAEKVHDAIEAIQTSLGSNDDKIWRKNKLRYSGLAMARGVINDTPTADVVPKSEVEELIAEFDKMVDLISSMTGLNVLAYGGKFAELKKKYTGEKYNDEVV